jgi:hypothetical protein
MPFGGATFCIKCHYAEYRNKLQCWHFDTQHDDIQHNNTQHNNKLIATLSINAIRQSNILHQVPLWWVSWLIYCHAECCFAERRYAECQNANTAAYYDTVKVLYYWPRTEGSSFFASASLITDTGDVSLTQAKSLPRLCTIYICVFTRRCRHSCCTE